MDVHESLKRALALFDEGQVDAAYQIASRILRHDPDNAAAWGLMALLVYDPANPIRALECLDRVLMLRPEDSQAQHYLWSIQKMQARSEDLPPSLKEFGKLSRDGTLILSIDRLAEHAASAPIDAAPETNRSGVPGWVLSMLVVAALALIMLGVVLLRPWENFPGFRSASAAEPMPAAEEASAPAASDPIQGASSTYLDFSLIPESTHTPTPGPAGVAINPTPTLVPVAVDYRPMVELLETYLDWSVYAFDYDFGLAFIDLTTGQTITIGGDQRYHAMSSFKGPLAVQYYDMLEQGLITPGERDEYNINLMLSVSSNTHTTCLFESVGGVPAFNDWLAEQGFDRSSNFVAHWRDWPCAMGNNLFYTPYTDDTDERYIYGDADLGLPGGSALLECPIAQIPCDKAFAPVELAEFYARLYRGEIINPAHRAQVLRHMERGPLESIFLVDLPPDAELRVYTKGGTHAAEDEYRVNFINEAGIIETPSGAFVLAMFLQRNPDWPGTESMERSARMIYDYFLATHEPLDEPWSVVPPDLTEPK